MPEFKTKSCSFSLCFMRLSMREMDAGKLGNMGKKAPLVMSGGEKFYSVSKSFLASIKFTKGRTTLPSAKV